MSTWREARGEGAGADEVEILEYLMARYAAGAELSPALLGQALSIARGQASRDVAAEIGVSYEAVRGRRARLYRTLQVEGAAQIVSGLLAISLEILSGRSSESRAVA
jgi:hypothetical protein